MQKQLLANYVQYSAILLNAKNLSILSVIYWESLNTHCELIVKSNIFPTVNSKWTNKNAFYRADQ